jgi:hypothetical protein
MIDGAATTGDDVAFVGVVFDGGVFDSGVRANVRVGGNTTGSLVGGAKGTRPVLGGKASVVPTIGGKIGMGDVGSGASVAEAAAGGLCDIDDTPARAGAGAAVTVGASGA